VGPVVALSLLVAMAAGAGAAGSRAVGSARTAPRAQAAARQQCADPYSSTRDPANPLALAAAPGANPLTGAHFFVDGPAHGVAAGAIAQLLGLNPRSLPDTESWSTFATSLTAGRLLGKLNGNAGLANQVKQLSKIAAQPEVQRVSAYSYGGGPGGIFAQTQKLLCHNLLADPGSILILNTYFLHPAAGVCPGAGALRRAAGTFRRRVNELAAAVERRPVVMLLETDAIGTSSCIRRRGGLGEWEALLRYEIGKMATLPHAVVYVEGGYEDSGSARYSANVLNAVGIRRIRGFFTNDTHINWTINEVHWATTVSRRTHGAHFIVNTAQNGNGPLLNPHPSSQGIEDLCNPPGRGLGPQPSTATGFALADAWLWTSPPGNSSGHCRGGPSGGSFWPARAIGLGELANNRLGPKYPSRPY
jgi:endoglucanase